MVGNSVVNLDKEEILSLENLMISDEKAVKLLRAMAHPLRLKILRILSFNEKICTSDFTTLFDQPQPIVSKQLAILLDEGLISYKKQTKKSGKFHEYSLVNEFKYLVYSIISLFSRQNNPKVEKLIEIEYKERKKMTIRKPNVLFLCTGNSARSQMAEAILRKKADDYFTVYSAGTKPQGIHPLTIRVMEEKGCNLSEHTSKHFNEYIGKVHMGIQIAVCAQAEKTCPRFPGVGTKLSWPFEDPASFEGSDDEKLDKFREIRDLIESRIDEWLQERNIPYLVQV